MTGTATRQLTVAASPDHERGVHANEAAGAGHQHRHRWCALRVAGALARVLRPLRVQRHVRPLQQRLAPCQQPQAPLFGTHHRSIHAEAEETKC